MKAIRKKLLGIFACMLMVVAIGQVCIGQKQDGENENLVTLQFYPKSYDFGNMSVGETASTTFEIWNSGCCTLTYTLTWECSWVDVFPTGGTSYGEHDPINVSINTTGLESGWHICEILIESNGGNGVFTVLLTIDESNEIPVIKIGDITGGLFKINAVIKNLHLFNGSTDATSVNWSITLDGGFILLGKETTGSIVNIPAGEEVTVRSKMIIGFGKTLITATAECAEGSSDTKIQEAFVLLFFIKI